MKKRPLIKKINPTPNLNPQQTQSAKIDSGQRPCSFQVSFSSPRCAARCPFHARQLEKALAAMTTAARNLNYPIFSVILRIMGDAEMSRINKNSLHLSGPTNILSFPGSRDMPSQLALSIDCWERECLTYQQMREIHFIQLLAHGFAHLANLEHGEEHDKLKDNCVMAALGSIN